MSANAKHVLLALFLCLGMLALSGPGIGPVCTKAVQKECTCCPMEEGESCCSSAEESIPLETPIVPETRAQQQPFQAILLEQPILELLPAAPQLEFPPVPEIPALSSAGPSVQALLCIRTV